MTTTEVQCPKCGGPMWDNRATKKNPKQPDFKCKDKTSCDGVIWPPKGASPYAAPAPASNVKAPHSSGPHIEGIDGPRPIVTPEYGDVEGQRSALAALQVGKLNGVLNLHDVCVDHAISVTVKKLGAANIPVTAGDVLAAAATMMIGAQKVGAAA